MSSLDKAKILAEALPYMQSFSGKQCVIKYGGAAMMDKSLASIFAQDVVMLQQVGIKPIVVHGGGPKIDETLARMNIKSRFIDGMRVTDEESIAIVEMVLSGYVNKNIVHEINLAGGRAIGICGKDDSLIQAKKFHCLGKDGKHIDLGYVGSPVKMNKNIIIDIQNAGIIPIISPICKGVDCPAYNVNADTVAGFIAQSIAAEKLLVLTNVSGILDANGKLVSELLVEEAELMIKNGVISSGMIPKVRMCINMIKAGCGGAHILDGRVPHVVLLELFTVHGSGTMISNN